MWEGRGSFGYSEDGRGAGRRHARRRGRRWADHQLQPNRGNAATLSQQTQRAGERADSLREGTNGHYGQGW